MRSKLSGVLGPLLLIATTATVAPAGTIVTYTGGPSLNHFSPVFVGESFTTPSPEGVTGWNTVTFNWFNTTPVAYGTAYIFNSVYGGTPNNLSTASYLAASTEIVGDKYIFPSLVIQPGTTYHIYENALIPIDGITGGVSVNPVAGISGYFTSNGNSNFTAAPEVNFNFLLAGDPITSAVPEPSTITLAALAVMCGVVGVSWARRRATA